MWCRATAPTIPFPTSETASLFRVPQNVCCAPGQHAAVLGGCCSSFVKNRAYQPSYMFFFRSARINLGRNLKAQWIRNWTSLAFFSPTPRCRTVLRAGPGVDWGTERHWTGGVDLVLSPPLARLSQRSSSKVSGPQKGVICVRIACSQ